MAAGRRGTGLRDILGVTVQFPSRPDTQRRWATTCSCTPASPFEVVDEQFALETIELVKQFPELADLEEAPTPA